MNTILTSKQKQIINAADSVLLEVGVIDFTVDKVVEHLGIAKGTVYKYFESKDDLLAEVSTKALNQLLNYFKLSERNTPKGIEQTRNILMSVYHYEQDYPRYFELLVHMERPDFSTTAESYLSISHLLQTFFTEHIQRQIDEGFIKPTVNPLISNYFCWGSCMGVMQFLDAKKAFLKDSEKIEQRELFESYVNVLIDGMRT
ncbi:TetR/AcrR family transcriptional regulator [Flagellimonas meridianipacifica]|uniref:AcrR family transcriptional regulator n=1 Tax=Flagellimonas meridianipacifica TaxID=1080225 RepID=A0A2T0MBI7_9FLAO|nr:TetR/AcrR family transcriptional regulator [Allomuricauda pacifica]PRX54859.1 AcrR family transcriptional regulator [Allomuricauda pacifica]